MADLLSREYEINYSHIDNRGIAKPSFLWNIMQDAATVHAEALQLGPETLHILWVLSRMKVRLTRPLRPYEYSMRNLVSGHPRRELVPLLCVLCRRCTGWRCTVHVGHA